VIYLFRFFVNGVAQNVLALAVFALFIYQGVYPEIASVATSLLMFPSTYFASKLLVFRVQGPGSFVQFTIKYLISSIIFLASAWFWGSRVSSEWIVVLQGVTALGLALINFGWQSRHFLARKRRST